MQSIQRVHLCDFCSASFHPRAQVKNPRACSQAECQRKRQRSNELAWREKNSSVADPQYHRIRKKARLKLLRQISEGIGRCLDKGATFLGLPILLDCVGEFFFQFLVSLGIRRVNKFWPRELLNQNSGLQADPWSKIAQTSSATK